MLRVESPLDDGLHLGVHLGRQFRTPDTPGAIEVLPTDDRTADGHFPPIVVHGNLRMSDKHDQAWPVFLQTDQQFALRLMQCSRYWRRGFLPPLLGGQNYRGSGALIHQQELRAAFFHLLQVVFQPGLHLMKQLTLLCQRQLLLPMGHALLIDLIEFTDFGHPLQAPFIKRGIYMVIPDVFRYFFLRVCGKETIRG